MVLYQRFFMRQSFSAHDRHVSARQFDCRRCLPHNLLSPPATEFCVATRNPSLQVYAAAALFLACKVEEQHRRAKHFVDAAHCVAHATEAPPESARDEASSEWRTRRDALLEAERVLLQTLEFDFAVEQPAAVITGALRKWRDAGTFGSRFEKVPELAALDRAAAALAFIWCVSSGGSSDSSSVQVVDQSDVAGVPAAVQRCGGAAAGVARPAVCCGQTRCALTPPSSASLFSSYPHLSPAPGAAAWRRSCRCSSPRAKSASAACGWPTAGRPSRWPSA